MDSPSLRINFTRKPRTKSKSFGACVPWLLFEAAETTSAHHPPDSSSSQSSFNSSWDSAAIVRSRVASLRGSLETVTHGNVQPRVYTLYISAVTSSWEQHAHMTDECGVEEEKEEEEEVWCATQCVTAARKFAILTCVRGTCRAGLTRVRSASLLFVFLSSLLWAKFVAKVSVRWRGRISHDSLSSRPLIACRVNIRLGDFRLYCVHCKSLSETSLWKSLSVWKHLSIIFKTFYYLKTDIYSRYAPLFY